VYKPMNNKQFLIAALGLGILLRFALMPFFAHVDLFSEARRVFYVLENDYLFDNGHRFVVFYIEVIFAWFSTLFIDVTVCFILMIQLKASPTLLIMVFS
jgi:hypothetical protein